VSKHKYFGVLYEVGVYFAAILITSLFWKNNNLVFFLLGLLWLIAILLWHDKYDFIAFIIAAVLGPIAEIICIRFGVWSYANSSLFGIPIWLPLLWGFAVVMLRRIFETLKLLHIV